MASSCVEDGRSPFFERAGWREYGVFKDKELRKLEYVCVVPLQERNAYHALFVGSLGVLSLLTSLDL